MREAPSSWRGSARQSAAAFRLTARWGRQTNRCESGRRPQARLTHEDLESHTTNFAHGFETFVDFVWDAERDSTARADDAARAGNVE